MTDIYIPGFPEVFRIIPSRPEYAVTETGRVLNLRTNRLMRATPEDRIVVDREATEDHVREVEIDVDYWIAELFGKSESDG